MSGEHAFDSMIDINGGYFMAVPHKGSLRKRFAAVAATGLVALSGATGIGHALPHTRDAGDDFLGDLQTTAEVWKDVVVGNVDVTKYMSEDQAHLFKDDQARGHLLKALQGVQSAVNDARHDPRMSKDEKRDLAAVNEALELAIPVIENSGVISLMDAISNRDIADKADRYAEAIEGLLENPGPFAEALSKNPGALDAAQNVLPDVLKAFTHKDDTVNIMAYLSDDQAHLFTDQADREELLNALNNLQAAVDKAHEGKDTKGQRKVSLEAVSDLISFVTPIVEQKGDIKMSYLTENLPRLAKISQYQKALDDLSGDLGGFADELRDHHGALDALDNVLPKLLGAFAPGELDRKIDVKPILSKDQKLLITNEENRQNFLTALQGLDGAIKKALTDPGASEKQKQKMANVDEMITVIIPIVQDKGVVPLSYLASHLGSIEKLDTYQKSIQSLLNDPMIIAQQLLSDTTTLQAAEKMLPQLLKAFHIHLKEDSILLKLASLSAPQAPATQGPTVTLNENTKQAMVTLPATP